MRHRSHTRACSQVRSVHEELCKSQSNLLCMERGIQRGRAVRGSERKAGHTLFPDLSPWLGSTIRRHFIDIIRFSPLAAQEMTHLGLEESDVSSPVVQWGDSQSQSACSQHIQEYIRPRASLDFHASRAYTGIISCGWTYFFILRGIQKGFNSPLEQDSSALVWCHLHRPNTGCYVATVTSSFLFLYIFLFFFLTSILSMGGGLALASTAFICRDCELQVSRSAHTLIHCKVAAAAAAAMNCIIRTAPAPPPPQRFPANGYWSKTLQLPSLMRGILVF